MNIKLLVFNLCLITTSHQFVLECEFGRLGWDDVITRPAYTCKVQNLNITTPKRLITSMKGQHPEGESNDNVNTLLIIEQICEFFPVGIEKQFQNLEGIAVQKSGLKKITKHDLKGFANLKSISLFGNQLKTLESNLFRYNPKLKLISVFNNKLKHVFSNIFDGLTDLERIYFHSNPCINEDGLNSANIEHLKCKLIENCSVTDEMKEYAELESEKLKIDFENAQLKENLSAVSKNFILTKRKLERTQESYKLVKNGFNVNATRNCETFKAELETCENDKFECAELIQELEVVEITCGALANLENKNEMSRCRVVGLKVLKPHYRIVKVKNADKSLFNPELVSRLEISDQQILFLPLKIDNFFPKIRVLSVKSSDLIMINEEAFNGLENLNELNLTNNKLLLVKAENFASLVELTKLDLSYNKIEFIEPMAFNSLTKLVELRLNHNFLVKLTSKLFAANNELRVVSLRNNSLNQIASNFLEFCCNRIEVLDFTNNQCIDLKFPSTSLDFMKETFIASCTVEIDFECKFESQVDYFCHAVNVKIESRNIKITSVKGDQKPSFSNADVTFLKVVNQSMEVWPQHIGKFLPNVKRVWIENSKLNAIENGSFVGFKGIEELTITFNFLTEIVDEMFEDLTELNLLDLSHNSIVKISKKAFEKLTNLKHLNLSYNKIKALNFESIQTQNVIEKFVISHNQLSSIDPQIIKLLKSAKLIDFEANTCISSRYDKAHNDERKIMEIFGEVSFKCIED